MNFSGKVGSSPRISAPSAPPRPASPEPKAKVSANTRLTLMPSPRHARIIHRCPQPAAETRAGQNELQSEREQAAHDDDQQTIATDADPEELESPLQDARNLDKDLLGAHHVVHCRNRHEDEPNGEQDLVEVAAVI